MSVENKIINERLKSLQNNIDRLLAERNEDKEDLRNKWEAMYTELAKQKSEIHILTNKLDNLIKDLAKTTKTVQESNEKTVDAVEEVAQEIKDNLIGKTKIIEKTIEHVGLLRWLLKPFRKKVI